MGSLHQVVNGLLNLLVGLLDLVLRWLGQLEFWLRAQLRDLGVAPPLQTIVLIIVAVLFLLAALRMLGGVIRLLVLIFLVLLIVHILAPGFHA